VQYKPRALDPVALEQRFRARSLEAPELKAFAAQVGLDANRWAAAGLDLPALTAIGCFYNPELDVARARWKAAEAALIAAGVRPNPTLNTGAGYARMPDSPQIFHLDPSFVIETAGKRRYRVLEAQSSAEAARLAVIEAGWQLRLRVRDSLIEYVFATRAAELLRAEEAARAQSVEVLEARFRVGDVSLPDVEAARMELGAGRLARKAAEKQAVEALAALAADTGLPAAALAKSEFQLPPAPGAPESVESIENAGLLHRVDVRRALAEYAASDMALRLEIARQYPDIDLTPGYAFDEAHHKFTLGPALPLPVFHRNRGQIAEAEARRAEVEARFTAVQAQAIAEVERAAAAYRGSWEEWQEAARQLAAQKERQAAVRKTFEAGEQDRLALAEAAVATAVAARAELDAQKRLQLAAAALESAVQKPLDGEPPIVERAAAQKDVKK